MTTYAKRPTQSPRLAQTAHKRVSIASEPSIAADVVSDRLIGTTLAPSGAMVPDIRLNRAEQSEGSAGNSSASQALSKTSAGVASGIPPISTSTTDGGHLGARAPVESNVDVPNVLNLHSINLNRVGPPTDEKMSGVVCFAVWLASALVCWGIVALVIYALSTAPG